MLTDKDFSKLFEIFATKKELREIVREEMVPFKKGMLAGFDRVITAIETQNLENTARDTQLTRHDGWIRQIATETEVTLKD